MWEYESSIGTLQIVHTPDGHYGFMFDNITWEACTTPEAQADNVYCHVTGCSEWDSCSENGPHDLSEWTYIPVRRK